FTAPDGANGPALWKRDGNTTALVKDLGQGTSARLLTNVNGALYFVVDGPGNTEALWKSNGSGANTGPVFAGRPPLSGLTAVGSTLYFIKKAATSPELWKSDQAGTALVRSLQSAFSPAFFDLTNINGVLVFAASDGTHGQELWTSNGASTGFSQDINVGAA